MSDQINHPDHYTYGSIECIDAIEVTLGFNGFIDYCRGNAIKYLWRWEHKGGVDDLRKAAWYINRMIYTLNGHTPLSADQEAQTCLYSDDGR